MEKFKKALKYGLRFPYKGSITTEDLFVLKNSELNQIYKTLCEEKDALGEYSLDDDSDTPVKEELNLKIEIVTEIFNDNKDAAEKARNARLKAEKNAEILKIIEEKQKDKLKDLSVDELKALIAD